MLFTILAAVWSPHRTKKIQAVPVATGALACYARRPPNVAQAYEIFHAMCDVSHILRHANDAAIKNSECEREGRGSRRDTKMSTGTSEVVNQPQWRRFSTAPLLWSLPFPPGVYTFIWLIGFSAAYRNCGALEWLKSAQLLWGKWKIWLPDSYAYAGSCHAAQKWRNFRTNMSPMSVPRNTLRQQRRQGGKEKKREREVRGG